MQYVAKKKGVSRLLFVCVSANIGGMVPCTIDQAARAGLDTMTWLNQLAQQSQKVVKPYDV